MAGAGPLRGLDRLGRLGRAQGKPLGHALPRITLGAHLSQLGAQLGDQGVRLGDLRRCLGRRRGRREHPVQLDRLDGPSAAFVARPGNLAALDRPQDCRAVHSAACAASARVRAMIVRHDALHDGASWARLG